MKISIHAPEEIKRNGFCESAFERVAKAMERFADRITSITLTLTDENSQRGGVDKRCRLSVVMPGVGELAASAQHEDASAAVGQAVDKARRVLLTKIKRPKAIRTRRRKNFAGQTVPQLSAAQSSTL